jgi:hypothetical protein
MKPQTPPADSIVHYFGPEHRWCREFKGGESLWVTPMKDKVTCKDCLNIMAGKKPRHLHIVK